MGEYVFVKHCVDIRGKIVENKALKEKKRGKIKSSPITLLMMMIGDYFQWKMHTLLKQMCIVLQSHVMKSSYEMFHLMGFNGMVMEGV
jgi:hypothetical protein